MALRLRQKEAIVAEVNAAAAASPSAVLADYRGMSVSEMTALRAQARAQEVTLRVVRNTLARRAVAGTEHECLTDALSGPTLLVLANEEPGSAARLIVNTVKEYDQLEVKALSIGGALLPATELERVAALPDLDGARAMLMAVLLAPISRLAATLNETPAKLVRTLAAVGEAKQAT